MAQDTDDNVELPATGATTFVAASEYIGGKHYQPVIIADATDPTQQLAISSGGLTANLGATDNAVLDAIQVATEATQAAVEGNLTVDLGATDNAVLDSAVALLTTIDADTGGIATSAAVMDDWDESDRAKVNLIVGQAGIAAGTGTDGATVPRVTLATNVALPAGTNAIGKLAANSGVDIGDVDVTSISAGTNAIGNVGLIGRASGGMTIFRSLDIDETEEEIKGTAGQVFSISAFNMTNAALYLKFYNATAANVTVGSTTPVLTFVVPGNNDTDGSGFIWNNDIGFAFSTAIAVACTTGVADADTGAPAGNACIINVGYA